MGVRIVGAKMTKAKLFKKLVNLAVNNVYFGHGGPFAAAIVCNREIVHTGCNQVLFTKDPTAHAEIQAIRGATKKLNTFDLSGCDLYTTCYPCPMCLGAAYWAKVDRIIYASTELDAKKAGFSDKFIYDQFDLPPYQRKIKEIKVTCRNATKPFQAWILKQDKVPY
jgi:guanine deaminase